MNAPADKPSTPVQPAGVGAPATATVLTAGTRNPDVIRVQRALNAAITPRLRITGAYNRATQRAVVAYQKRVGIKRTGVVATLTWRALSRGRR